MSNQRTLKPRLTHQKILGMAESKRGGAKSAKDFAEGYGWLVLYPKAPILINLFQTAKTQRFPPRSPRLRVSLKPNFDASALIHFSLYLREVTGSVET
jgi:hypothetical protein